MKILELCDSMQRDKFVFLPQAHFGLELQSVLGISTLHRHYYHVQDITNQCKLSKTVFRRTTWLCTGSLFCVSLLDRLGSWFLQGTAKSVWLWCRDLIRFLGLGHHRGDPHVAALDLLLHVREIC